jgi:hypothetical protein
METFWVVLAANAVSNGPSSVNHLVSKWIVPCAENLPPFGLSWVTLHLAIEEWNFRKFNQTTKNSQMDSDHGS